MTLVHGPVAGALAEQVAQPRVGIGAGHAILTRAAAAALPAAAPAFLRQGADLAAHCVYDPDVIKNPAVPHLSDAEHPEHYLDLELLEGAALPAERYEFLALCARLQVSPSRVGLLPYATIEWTERLAVALAEHRRWPENEAVRTKALVYAGLLSYYAADLLQPLHTTIHFDGRAGEGGQSPHSGIHEKVDALVERLDFAPEDLARGLEVAAYDDAMAAILETLRASHGMVDRVYELEAELGTPTDPQVKAFARERARATTAFIASLYMTAWEQSVRVAGVKRGPTSGIPTR